MLTLLLGLVGDHHKSRNGCSDRLDHRLLHARLVDVGSPRSAARARRAARLDRFSKHGAGSSRRAADPDRGRLRLYCSAQYQMV